MDLVMHPKQIRVRFSVSKDYRSTYDPGTGEEISGRVEAFEDRPIVKNFDPLEIEFSGII